MAGVVGAWTQKGVSARVGAAADRGDSISFIRPAVLEWVGVSKLKGVIEVYLAGPLVDVECAISAPDCNVNGPPMQTRVSPNSFSIS
jgi:hypothetical protein